MFPPSAGASQLLALHFPTTFFPQPKALELRAEQAKEAQEALQMTLQAEAGDPPVSGLEAKPPIFVWRPIPVFFGGGCVVFVSFGGGMVGYTV